MEVEDLIPQKDMGENKAMQQEVTEISEKADQAHKVLEESMRMVELSRKGEQETEQRRRVSNLGNYENQTQK